MSHLFIRHYVTTILNRPSPVIPPAMFTQIFFTSVFQLLMGNQITNKKAMSEEFRQDIETAFAAFRATYGPSGSGPLCPPVSSAVSRRRPITFGLALASTAIQCSKDWRTLVVEGVPDCFIKLISTKLRRLVPELKHGHARPYALYVYDTIAQDPKFVPELPNIASMSADLKAKVQSKFDYVINDCNALLDPAIRQIQNELQDIRALAEERQRHQAFQRACRATPSTANPAASSSSSSNVPPSLAFDPLTSADIDSEDAMSLDMAESISTVIGLDHLHLQSIAGSDSDNASSIAPDALDDQHDAITNNSNNNVMLTTATLSRWPHLFLPIMANVLQTLESWNNHDNELPPALQTEASLSWVRHVLSEVPDWKKIGHQKRTRLVSAIAKVINDSSTPFDARKLPRSFDAESRDIIKGLVENAKRQLNEGSFAPATYLYSPPSRLFPLLPVPSFRLRFVRINSSTMGTLLNHFGIKPPLAGPSVGPPVENASEPLDSPHKNFDLLDLSKFKK
ncbi:hypothetical protein DM01DRAFT_1376271 [Hesseltinella vesiculosa]|uniref:Uncharacterized protein n=1 Tax=Hesseltinella vesiculosa TaxID=101127 RepID=A0A1X2GAS3_9FUNG|nr:hypothetical protein DM01DRAFT_1376271 [Hesseltinella vesiculosa]